MIDRQETPDRSPDERESREAEDLREDERQEAPPERGRGPTESEPDRKGDQEPEKRRRSPWIRVAAIAALVAAVIGGAIYWWSNKDLESTDDAYTDGRAVLVAPQVSGYVVALAVNDNQLVHRGDLLVEIDPRDYLAARDQAQGNLESVHGQLESAKFAAEVARKNFPAQLAQAQAQLASARANLVKAQSDYTRQRNLPRAATTQQEVDNATAAQQQAQAQVQLAEAQVQQAMPVEQNIGQADTRVEQLDGLLKQAQAQLDQANLNLSWTKVVAPQDGWVTKRNVERGNFAQSGQSILALVTPERWVTANFKETQLDRMRPGQKVSIEVDAYPSRTLEGHVDSVQLGSGSRFSAFPAENATGNFVKIVQRVPVKIVIDQGLDPKLPLPLGISVVPTVTLK
jgi:membrane fusion protein (multidrug efflux system)